MRNNKNRHEERARQMGLTPEEIQVLHKLHRRRHELQGERWRRRVHREHARFKHSLSARLIATFVVLALLAGLIVYGAESQRYGALWAIPLMLVVIVAAFATITRMIWPLRALARAAGAYGRGDFSMRVPVFHADEIGDLTHRFNQMATDIEAMLDGKRALLLAISHELRSPLTRARLHAELVEEGASRDALLQDLGEMRLLIDALLESERLGNGHSALQLQEVDLAALLGELDGVEKQIGDLPASLRLDPMRIRLLLRNLVSNAKRYNDAAKGPVNVSVGVEGQVLHLSVRDHGPGVPDEALPHLGEAFYRPDAARARSEGGVGLGLNLCKMIAAAHGGRLDIRNATPGLEVTLNLPVT